MVRCRWHSLLEGNSSIWRAGDFKRCCRYAREPAPGSPPGTPPCSPGSPAPRILYEEWFHCTDLGVQVRVLLLSYLINELAHFAAQTGDRAVLRFRGLQNRDTAGGVHTPNPAGASLMVCLSTY